MGDENVVAVQVTADVGSYVDAMKLTATATTANMDAVKSATASAAAQAGAAMDAMKTSAAEASEALAESMKASAAAAVEGGASLSSFGSKIRELGNEQRSEQRFGAFIARDLQAIVPAAGEAGNAVAELVSGLAYGSGIAVAVGAVKLLASAFSDGDSAVGKFSKDSAEALKKVREQVDGILASMRGETASQGFSRKNVAPLEEQRDQQAQAVQDAQARVTAEEQVSLSLAAQGQIDDANLHTAQEALAAAKAELEITEGRLRATKDLGGEVAEEERKKAAEASAQAAEASFQGVLDAGAKYGSERQKIEQQVDQKIAALHAQLLDGNEKLEAEYVNNVAAIDKMAGLTAIQREALKTAELMAYRKRLTDYGDEQARLEVERLKKADEDLLKSAAQITTGIREQIQARQHEYDNETKTALEGLKRIEEEERRIGQERIATAKEMASALGAALAGVVTGQESIAKAAAQMASAVIKSLMDIAIKTIETNALNAASGAAASQAGIPIVGPVLAVAAMASMEAMVLGLISSLPSAAGGMGSVPRDTLALVHAEEQIMPADLARGQRAIQTAFASGDFGGFRGGQSAQQPFAGDSDSGSGGDEIHVHFHVPAGAFLDQTTANRFIADPMVQRAISNAVRTGRWGNP